MCVCLCVGVSVCRCVCVSMLAAQVYLTAGAVLPSVVQAMLQSLLNDDFQTAHDCILQRVCESGYAVCDIVTELSERIVLVDLPDPGELRGQTEAETDGEGACCVQRCYCAGKFIPASCGHLMSYHVLSHHILSFHLSCFSCHHIISYHSNSCMPLPLPLSVQ